MRKGLSLFIALVLVLSSTTMAFGQASDYASSWAKDEIDYMREKGILKGYPDGTFRPNDNMAKSEFYKVINSFIGFTEKEDTTFKDVEPGDWYYEEAKKGVAAGYINPEEKLNASENITRGEVVRIISLVLGVEEDEDSAKSFYDYPSFPEELKGKIGGLVKGKLITGYPDNTFKPNNEIARAEVVKILHNIGGVIINEKGTVSKDIEGNLLVNTKDVKLKDMVIDGNLYLTAGVGEGDVSLDNVEVKGELSIQGGGSNSILINNSKINKMLANKYSGLVRVVLDNTSVEELIVLREAEIIFKNKSKAKFVELDGDISLNLEKGTVIEELNVKNGKIEITSKGTIKSLKTEVDIKVNGKEVKAGNEVKDKPVSVPSTGGTSSGGSGGGSSGGGSKPDPEPEPEPEIITIKAIKPVENISVEYGTTEDIAKSKLASTTTIVDSKDEEHSVDLTWMINEYNGNMAGDYTAIGTFELPEGISQTDPVTELEVKAIVTVQEEVTLYPSISVDRDSVQTSTSFKETFKLTVSNDRLTGKVSDNEVVLGGVFEGLNIMDIDNDSTTVTATVYGELKSVGIGKIGIKANVLERSSQDLIANVLVNDVRILVTPSEVNVSNNFREVFTLEVASNTVTESVYGNDIVLGGVFTGLTIGSVERIDDKRVTAEVYGQLTTMGIGNIGISSNALVNSEENLMANVKVNGPVMNFIEDSLLGDGFGLGRLVIYKEFANDHSNATNYSVVYSVGSSTTTVATEKVKLGTPIEELIQYKEGINSIDIVLYSSDGVEITTIKDIMKK